MSKKKANDKFCQHCGKERNTGKKYCSIQCIADAKWEEKKKELERRGFVKDVGNNRTARRYLKETTGHRCAICGNTEWRGKPIPLILDHIDGNSSNNWLCNLRLICGNCDMQLPTYKSKNKGNGRHWRKMRYQAGKSY